VLEGGDVGDGAEGGAGDQEGVNPAGVLVSWRRKLNCEAWSYWDVGGGTSWDIFSPAWLGMESI
jgi:hypothetical protein